MGYYRSIFLVPVFCYSHVLLCSRTLIPFTHWNISENFPRFFYWNFHKINMAFITNTEIIYRWEGFIISDYFNIPIFFIIPFFFYRFKAVAKECLAINRIRA